MPTRRRQEDEPIAFERYMSSGTYTERRPIPFNVVAEKAAGYSSPADRRLLFWLQAMSMRPGGLFEFAGKLLAAFPSSGQFASNILPDTVMLEESFSAYLAGSDVCSADFDFVGLVQKSLIRLCINPAVDLDSLRGIPRAGILEVLETYRLAQVTDLRANRVITSLGKVVHGCLDKGLATRRMVVIEGESGSGKTFEARAWCEEHLGEARFIDLTGITNRTGFFQKIGAALGIGICQQASSKLQAKIEGVLASTKLMLVIDEAHFLWPQHRRNHSSPELVDWVDTALVNSGVPVALIATDQFATLKARVEKQTGWTSAQFMHRTFRYTKLQERPSRTDLEAVTTHLLSMRWSEDARSWINSARSAPVSTAAVKAIVGYAGSSFLPLPSVRSIVEEARFLAQNGNGRDIVGLRDVAEALTAQTESDIAMRKAFSPLPKKHHHSAKLPHIAKEHAPDPAVDPSIDQPGTRNFAPSGNQQMSRNSSVVSTNPALRRARASELTGA
ncbi:MAG: ATP-binding protein [Chthoniobacterales bacterium]|nr:ATP-binding protein [Chthoniobacterales bacterium]